MCRRYSVPPLVGIGLEGDGVAKHLSTDVGADRGLGDYVHAPAAAFRSALIRARSCPAGS
jgi:hypothetical protein